MSRSTQPPGGGPIAVHDDDVYTLPQLLAALPFLTRNSIRREVREGRLVPSRVCGHYLITGAEIKRWIAAAQVRRKTAGRPCACPADGAPAPAANSAHGGAGAGGRRKGGGSE